MENNLLKQLKQEKFELRYIVNNAHLTNVSKQELEAMEKRIKEIEQQQALIYRQTDQKRLVEERLAKYRNKGE